MSVDGPTSPPAVPPTGPVRIPVPVPAGRAAQQPTGRRDVDAPGAWGRPVGTEATPARPAVSNEVASARPVVSNEVASARPAVSNEAVSARPAVRNEAVSARPAVRNEAVSARPAVSVVEPSRPRSAHRAGDDDGPERSRRERRRALAAEQPVPLVDGTGRKIRVQVVERFGGKRVHHRTGPLRRIRSLVVLLVTAALIGAVVAAALSCIVWGISVAIHHAATS